MSTVVKTRWAVALGLAIIFLAIVFGWLLCAKTMKVDDNHFPGRGLPVINIELNGVTQDEINSGSKDIKYGGNELSLYNNGNLSRYDDVEVKGRGNSTWTWDKRPYRIKFDEKVDMLGMGKAKKWCLLANYKDGTNLRTEVGFTLEEMLGMKYTMEGRFVELYMDGNYQGLYYLTKAVEVSSNVVDLKDELGVLAELDNVYGMQEEKYYVTERGDMLTMKDMVNEENEEEAMEGFLASYNELEKAVKEGDYERVQELADMESFAQYYLLSEFTVNPDAYWTSFYMYRDGTNDKIHAGPGWDFDMALANRYWGNWLGERLYSPTETMVRRSELTPKVWVEMGNDEEDFVANGQIGKIMYSLVEMPEFREEIVRVFQERMMGKGQELVGKITAKAVSIYKAAMMDGKNWNKKEYENEVRDLVRWIKTRYDYFEEVYGGGEWDLVKTD